MSSALPPPVRASLLLLSALLPACNEYGFAGTARGPGGGREPGVEVSDVHVEIGEADSGGDGGVSNDDGGAWSGDGGSSGADGGTDAPGDGGAGDGGAGDGGAGDGGAGDGGTDVVDEPEPEPDAQVCEDTEGGDCNGDLGYGDQCDSSYNTGGCSAEKFWAWCNRRNTAYPNIWYDYLHDWVDDRCDGTVLLLDPDGDGYQTYTCVNSDGTVYECTTPLVLVFDPRQAVAFGEVAHRFPLDPHGADRLAYDWPSAATPWLALDRDGNGRIDDGSELFGSASPLSTGGRAAHGFQALADLDADGDGRLTLADPAFTLLLLWADLNGDGRSQPSELRRVVDAGVVELALRFDLRLRCDDRGNCERERSAFVWRDVGGALREGAVVDVYLAGRRDDDGLAMRDPDAPGAAAEVCPVDGWE